MSDIESFFREVYVDGPELDAFIDRVCTGIESGFILSLGSVPAIVRHETRMVVNSRNIDEISRVSATPFTWTKVSGSGYNSLVLYHSPRHGLVRVQHVGSTCMWRKVREEELVWQN